MDKVVILGRVSTDSQDYQRQINELNDYCNQVGWEVVNVFTNKISGNKSIEERTELQDMIKYIKENEVSRVVFIIQMRRFKAEKLTLFSLLPPS